MNPAQLLNPKAFAKEQAKGRKTSSNYGPQQTRKPASSLTEQGHPSYNPRALLNPKAVAASAKDTSDQADHEPAQENASKDEQGASKMLEDFYGLTNRENPPAKKRKVHVVDDGSDEERSKSKSTFSHGRGTGIIGEHMKQERARLASSSDQQPDNTIDLTNDNDEDDVQIVRDTGNEEVCLGVLHGSINANKVPRVAQGVIKDRWPRSKIVAKKPSTANQVINMLDKEGNAFGVLDVKTAVGIGHLMDAEATNRIRLRFYLVDRPKKPDEYIGKRVSESLKVEIVTYAPRNRADMIGKYLSQRQLFFSRPLVNLGKEVYNPQQPKIFGGPVKTNGSTSRNPTYAVPRTQEEMRRESDVMFDKLAKAEDLPEMDADPSIITSELMTHQKKALHFLTEHERTNFGTNELPAHSLWEFKAKDNGAPSWYHRITYEEVTHKPASVQGGILADAMGLGKTLSILALIASTKDLSRSFRQEDPPGSESVIRNAKGTLIVCPKSVLSNWQQQINAHTAEDKVRFYTYHGTDRTQDLEKLSRYDIVLTSYNTVASEFGDNIHRKRALESLNWFRIVLDEAHSIRTQTTKLFKSCCALNTQRRWAVTGTPVQNSLHDLGALIKFIRLQPFENPAKWTQYIMSPFKNGDIDVIQKLQVLVGNVTLRRQKESIKLPPRTEVRERLEFSRGEAVLYAQFASVTRSQLHGITGGGNALRGKAYAHVLKSLGRLRAICAHGREMLTEDDMQDVEMIASEGPKDVIVFDIGDEPELEDPGAFTSDRQAYEYLANAQDSEADSCESCGDKLVRHKMLHSSNTDGEDGGETSDSASSSDEETRYQKAMPPEPGSREDLVGHLTPDWHFICPKCTDRHKHEVAERIGPDGRFDCPYGEHFTHYGLFPLRLSGLRRFRSDREGQLAKPKSAKWDENTYSGPHTKVKALLADLAQSAEESAQYPDEQPVRSVVFSSWTAYLDLIEYALAKNDIGFARIDGRMSVKQRSAALATFSSDPSVVVLVVSIKAGGQGLNFTAANKVYVMEPQFNPGVEQQAVDRVHRIGQTREVTIKHFIMKDSVEEKILALQKTKEDLAQLAMEKKRSKAEEKKQKMADVIALFK